MNEPKLKLAMARLLPEKIRINTTPTEDTWYQWIELPPQDYHERTVWETEWLYVMQLVEQSLDESDKDWYCEQLRQVITHTKMFIHEECKAMLFATFNQRATAMCKVKGIEI
jgi:hypothetical protein